MMVLVSQPLLLAVKWPGTEIAAPALLSNATPMFTHMCMHTRLQRLLNGLSCVFETQCLWERLSPLNMRQLSKTASLVTWRLTRRENLLWANIQLATHINHTHARANLTWREDFMSHCVKDCSVLKADGFLRWYYFILSNIQVNSLTDYSKSTFTRWWHSALSVRKSVVG